MYYALQGQGREKRPADEQTHQFLLSLGYTNVENTIRFPCYSAPEPSQLPMLVVRDYKITSINDLVKIYYDFGRLEGKKQLTSEIAHFLHANTK